MHFSSALKYFFQIRKMSTDLQKVIAVCQLTSNNNKKENLESVSRLVEKAKENNAIMAFFPEAVDYISANATEYRELAECLDGPMMNSYRSLAEKHHMWLSIGGFHERNKDDLDTIHISHVVIDSEGQICNVYRKIHLFNAVIPEKGINLRESSFVCAGNNVPTPVETPVGKLGLSICYDLRFPELSLSLRKLGAQILTFPSAFTAATGEAHWEALLRARAIENQCYVVAAAQFGKHNDQRTSHGHSMIVDPWGKIIAECEKFEGEQAHDESLALATIDGELLEKVRCEMPLFHHRRDDIYTLTVNNATKDLEGCEDAVFKFAHITIPEETVFYATEHSFAFTNIRCVVPGHVLVSTRRVAKRMENLTPEEVSDLFQTVIKVQKVLEEKYETNSSTICVQDGEDAGQTIAHVHVHILPRVRNDFSRNDDIYTELAKHDRDNNPNPQRSLEEMTEEANNLKSLLL